MWGRSGFHIIAADDGSMVIDLRDGEVLSGDMTEPCATTEAAAEYARVEASVSGEPTLKGSAICA